MASPLDAHWQELELINHELELALQAHREEIARLRQIASAKLELARQLGRTDLIERLEALLLPFEAILDSPESGPEPGTEVLHPAPTPEPQPPAELKPTEEPAEILIEPSIPPTPTLDLPRVTPAKRPASKSGLREFRKALEAAFARERSCLEIFDGSILSRFQVREVVCTMRGLAVWAQDLEEPANAILESLGQLEIRHSKWQFFGFNPERHHSRQQWEDLALAYRLLGDCQRALEWNGRSDVEGLEKNELLYQMAAANVYLPRLSFDFGYGFTDGDQTKQREEIEKFKPKGVFVPFWQFSGEAPSLAEVRAKAGLLASNLEGLKARSFKHATREVAKTALAALTAEFDSNDSSEDFVETLRKLVGECLISGVRPSEKEFTRLLLPYRHHLSGIEAPNAQKLLDYLRKEETQLIAKHAAVAEPDPVYEGSSSVQESLRSFLAGKKVLMIGGRSDKQRVKALQEALGCSLEWPDSTESTNIEFFRPFVDRSDIVCRFIRWSRHSYKEILDWATDQGKPTVTFKAGSGVNRVVHDLAEHFGQK